ncbi:hypothetical protein WKI45_10940 [Delftia tsuruhatensis]
MNQIKLNVKSKYFVNVIEGVASFALVLAFWLFSMPATAQILPVVTITDNFAYGGGFGVDGFEFNRGGGAGTAFSGYPLMMGFLNFKSTSLEDVRCTGEASQGTTSHADPNTRWMAAEAVFRVVRQSLNTWQKIFGRGTTPWHDGKLRVVYADGGSEIWLVTSPGMSAALAPSSVPGSLKLGDGIPKPHHVCGKS